MTATRLTIAAVFALALPVTNSAPAEPKRQVTALTPQDVRWTTPADSTDGRQRAHLLGDWSTGGDWADRVRIPGGEIVTVLEGTWYLGLGR